MGEPQAYNLMIRFECNHVICLHCFQMLPSPALPVKCNSCQKPTQNFRYKFQTVLSCDRCSQQKAVEEFWWCDDCCQTVCSLCAMQHHKNCDTSNWDDMRIWKFFVEETQNRIQGIASVEKEKIDKFLDEIRDHLYEQIEKSANSTRDVLLKEDTLVTQTFDIQEPKTKRETPRNFSKTPGANEILRLRTKSHLMKLLENLRFGGKKLDFELELRRFVPPDMVALDSRMQAMNIDGVIPKKTT